MVAPRLARKNARTILQDQSCKFARRQRGVYLADKAFFYQFWYPTDMIEVRMRDEKIIDRRHIITKSLIVLLLSDALALDHAAIDKDLLATRLKQKISARDRADLLFERDVSSGN